VETPRLAFYALVWLSVVLVGVIIFVVAWLSGEDRVIHDHRCTDEDLVRLATIWPTKLSKPARWPK